MLQSLPDIYTNDGNCGVDGFVYSLDAPQALSSTLISSSIFLIMLVNVYDCVCMCVRIVCMLMWRTEVNLSWCASSAALVSFEKGFRLFSFVLSVIRVTCFLSFCDLVLEGQAISGAVPLFRLFRVVAGAPSTH